MPAKIRAAVFGGLAAAAAAVNNVAYNLAVRSNIVQGWLLEHRTVPRIGDTPCREAGGTVPR